MKDDIRWAVKLKPLFPVSSIAKIIETSMYNRSAAWNDPRRKKTGYTKKKINFLCFL